MTSSLSLDLLKKDEFLSECLRSCTELSHVPSVHLAQQFVEASCLLAVC